jgi:Protein of unknown function (DUF3054)
MPAWAGVGLDAGAVLVFAAVGRLSHQEGWSVAGVLLTAWPFLVGAAVGWVVVRLRSGRWPLAVGPGIPVLVCSVVVGMALRAVTGQGTAPAFVAVASVVLAVLLLGWRAVAAKRSPR